MWLHAHGGCTNSIKESALKADSRTKILATHRESNMCQYCTWLFTPLFTNWATFCPVSENLTGHAFPWFQKVDSVQELMAVFSIAFIATAQFTALAQTPWALVMCDYQWVTVAFYGEFLNGHQSGVLTALFSCYMASATWNCCHLSAPYNYAPVYSATSFKATYVRFMCV